MLEPYLNHTILIELPSGELIRDKQLAVTEFHAIAKSHGKYYEQQTDITKYIIRKPTLKLS